MPFYRGLTLEQLAGRGVRWPERGQAQSLDLAGSATAFTPREAPATADSRLRLGTFRSIWASLEVDASPALAFLSREQTAELSPADARRLGVRHGELVEISDGEHSISARVVLREATPAGTVFVESQLREQSSNALTGPLVSITRRKAASEPEPEPELAESAT